MAISWFVLEVNAKPYQLPNGAEFCVSVKVSACVVGLIVLEIVGCTEVVDVVDGRELAGAAELEIESVGFELLESGDVAEVVGACKMLEESEACSLKDVLLNVGRIFVAAIE